MDFQSLVSIAPWTMIAQWCNLLILMLLIKKFLFKPVQKIVAQRKAETEALYTDAEKAKADAEAMQAEYTQRLASAKAEAAQLVQEATHTATLRSEEIVADAKNEAAQLKSKADADIAQQRKAAVNEIKTEIGGIAMDIASKVVEREISAKDHEALIDEFIQNVGDAS